MDVVEVESLVTPRTRLIVINSPHNPTGSILTADDIRDIARIANEHDLVVLADEIYGRLQYEGEPLSIATLPGMAERTITLDGFSKTFAMTGWRLGYGIVPEWLMPSYSRLGDQQRVVHQRLRAGGRRRRADRSAGRARSVPRGVHRPPRPDRGRTERHPRRELRHAARRLLRLPQHVLVRAHQCRGRRSPAVRRGRLRAGRHRLRPPRRGLPALQLRQQSREHQPRRRAHRRVAGAPEQHR